MCVTFDDSFVFTAGNDGTIVIYEIMDKEMRIKIDKEGIGMQFAEEFLMPRETYNEKN